MAYSLLLIILLVIFIFVIRNEIVLRIRENIFNLGIFIVTETIFDNNINSLTYDEVFDLFPSYLEMLFHPKYFLFIKMEHFPGYKELMEKTNGLDITRRN